MEQLPAQYAGRTITYRIPHEMPGEAVIPVLVGGKPQRSNLSAPGLNPNQLAPAFGHDAEIPFEIHRMIASVIPMKTVGGVVMPFEPPGITQAKDVFADYIRVDIQQDGTDNKISRVPTILSTLLEDETQAWEFEVPYTLVENDGFEVVATNLLAGFNIVLNDENVAVTHLRVALSFQGYYIVLAPPPER